MILHVDYMCNECGNCKSFCPYASAPYKDKFTLFANEADLTNSTNEGFAVLDHGAMEVLVRYNGSSLLIDCGEGTQIAVKEKGWSFKPIDVI